MELYLLRHAHAGDPAKWRADDADRPLTAKGREQCERLAALMAGIGLRPDAVVSSPLVRALETARLATEPLGVTVATDERLVDFDLDALAGIVRDLGGPARLLVVGHDPDFSMLVADLTGAPSIPMRKGTLARIDLDLPPAPGGGVLCWLIPPEVLARS